METFNTELLGAENKLILHTDRISDNKLQTIKTLLEKTVPQNIKVEQYNHHIEVSWRDINKYANFKTSEELSEFVTKEEFQNDLTSDGWWVYPMPLFQSAIGIYHWNWLAKNPKLRVAHVYAPKCTCYHRGLGSNANLEEVVCTLKNVTAEGIFEGNTALKKLKLHAINELFFGTLCSGLKNLSEVDITWEEGTSIRGGNAFSGCILNKESAVRMLERLPEMSGQSMTLGINIDLQNDEEVWTAIHDAEAKRWTLTVQWNPGGPTYTTPESTTLRL